MEKLYIIDASKPYSGQIVNTMPFVEKGSKNGADILKKTYVHYSGATFEEYNNDHGGNLLALSWEEFNKTYHLPYLKSLQGPFEEVSEERFLFALECLPPVRWTRFIGGEYFFISEAQYSSIHSCYVRIGQKYYTALRCIATTTTKEIQTLMSVELKPAPPIAGYELTKWDQKGQQLATAAAYLERENLGYVENSNGHRYTLTEIKAALISN